MMARQAPRHNGGVLHPSDQDTYGLGQVEGGEIHRVGVGREGYQHTPVPPLRPGFEGHETGARLCFVGRSLRGLLCIDSASTNEEDRDREETRESIHSCLRSCWFVSG